MQHVKAVEYPKDTMTSLQGYVTANYRTLVALFGKPNDGDGYKVDAEWNLQTPYGFVTIYNYKDGKNYCGKEGTATTKITDWHIGGTGTDAVPFIQSVVEAYELAK